MALAFCRYKVWAKFTHWWSVLAEGNQFARAADIELGKARLGRRKRPLKPTPDEKEKDAVQSMEIDTSGYIIFKKNKQKY